MTRDDWKRLMYEIHLEALDVPILGDLTEPQMSAIHEHMERVGERIKETIPSPENLERWDWPPAPPPPCPKCGANCDCVPF